MIKSRCAFFDDQNEANILRDAKGLSGIKTFLDIINNQYMVSW